MVPIIFSILLGWLFGNYIYKEYSDFDKNYTKAKTVYFLQQGVYSNQDNYKQNIAKLDSYTTIEDNQKYYVYVGITNSYKDALNIQKIYSKHGYNLYIKEDKINNQYFLNDLKQYSVLLENSNDYKKLNSVLKAILASYEENVLES